MFLQTIGKHQINRLKNKKNLQTLWNYLSLDGIQIRETFKYLDIEFTQTLIQLSSDKKTALFEHIFFL